MSDHNFLLVDESALPDIFKKVMAAKQYLIAGTASSTSEAGPMARISRSAFYKYKDAVYPYKDKASSRLITLHAVLQDKPGVLMSLISAFYAAGANILTVNQNIPVMGVALVSISARVDCLRMSLDELLDSLRSLDGVQTIENIAGE